MNRDSDEMTAVAARLLAVREGMFHAEKVARRGFHMSREYAVDPLEILFVREVMRSNVLAIDGDTPIEAVRQALRGAAERRP